MSTDEVKLMLLQVRAALDEAIAGLGRDDVLVEDDKDLTDAEWDAYADSLGIEPVGYSAEQSSPESKPTSPPVVALSGPAFLGAQLGKKGRPRNELDDLVRDYSEEDRAVALAAYREQIPERRRIEGEVWQVASLGDNNVVHCVRVTNGFVGGFRCTFPADMWSTAAVVEA